jgi:protoheme IX farnesyltransferase
MKQNRISDSISVFGGLTKYRLSLAVSFSSVTGYFLANNYYGKTLFFLSAGVFLLASGSAAMNQYTERRADSLMERTRNRPLPSGKISVRATLIFAVMLLAAGSVLLRLNGTTPLILGLITVVLYNVVYTRLKMKTVFSIVPGALVGAIPPMIGYASAGVGLLNINILAFTSFMFLWQLPHFWLILTRHSRDYSAAGFATISKYLTDLQIRYLVFIWVLITTIFILLFFILAKTPEINLFVVIALLNSGFIFLFHRLLFRNEGKIETRGAFILINSVSLIIMILIIVESFLK